MIGTGILRTSGPARGLLAAMVFLTMLICAPITAMAVPFAGIVMDARTGRVLWEQNADTRLHPASLTKMLTLYIAFDAIRRGELREDDMVTVSAYAASQPPSRLGLKAGQKIQLRYLIRAAAIKSANDAAAAIGDHIAGSHQAFAQRMNRTAKALGMSRSSFRNAHGLTAEGHLSTARDMTLLGRRLFYDFPQFYSIFSRLSEDAGIARVNSTNRRFLESYRGADGIKTGYTGAAGFNLTASAERGNVRLVATVIGGTSTANRNARMTQMLDKGFAAAPGSGRVSPPPPPVADQDAVAAVAAPARVQTTLAASPRPARRPNAPPAAALAQVTTGVNDLLASLEAPKTDDAVSAALASIEEAPEAKPERPAEVASLMTADIRPQRRPEMPAQPVEEAVKEQPAEELPFKVATDVRPPARSINREPVEPQAGEAPQPEPIQIAEADLPDELPAPADDDAEAIPAASRTGGKLIVPKLADAEQAAPSRSARGEIVMTMAKAETEETPTRVQRVAAQSGEVVSRVSTSGGRHWAITLGNFNSRPTAERALLQTALSETRTLEGSLRKVIQRSNGFEATFAGLSRDQAELACRRLQARAISCFTLGP